KREKFVPKLGEVNRFVEKLMELIYMHGVDGHSLLNKMITAYHTSLKAGTPITSLTELMDAAELSETEKEVFQIVATPVFQMYMWQFLTNSDSVWDINGNERWKDFSAELLPSMEFISGVSPIGLPPSEYEDALEEETKFLKKLMKKFGFKFDLRKLSDFRPSDLQELGRKMIDALSIEGARESYRAAVKVLGEFGMSVVESTFEFVQVVNSKTIGRNPVLITETSPNFMSDITLSNYDGKMYVRNEADGTFVEMTAPKEKISEQIRNYQENFLSLLNIKLPLAYLHNYVKLNGDLSKLKERALQHRNAMMVPNENGFVTLTEEDVITNPQNKNIIVAEAQNFMAEYNGKTYRPILYLKDGKTVYLKDESTVTSQMLRQIVKEYDVMKSTPKQIVSFGNRFRRIKALKNEITNKTCN
ncbi:MAG: hypothetical protein WD512_17890, partial [Candidatus Paceibacterota bacterium]